MDYLLDTNHWSYLQRRHPHVVARVESLPEETTLYMPVIAQAELLAGIELAASLSRREELRILYEQVVAQATDVLSVTSEVAEGFARIFARLKRKGTPIGTNDMWIAAIAMTHGLVLVTNNDHFRYVDGLPIEDWTKPMEKDRPA